MTSPRRGFLKRATGALLAGSLAGCLSDGSGTETDPSGGSGDPTDAATDSPTATAAPTATATDAETATATETATAGGSLGNADYAAWLPAPDAFDRDHYTFASVATGALVDLEASLSDGAVSEFERDSGVPGVGPYADASAVHVVADRALVFETDVATDDAAAGLEERGLSEADTHRGFTLYTGDSGAAAVREDALVSAVGLQDADAARSTVEAVVDAEAGEATRYAEAASACDLLTDALGTGHLIRGRTHSADQTFDGAVGDGVVFEVGAEETRVATPVVFREGQASEGPVVEWASGADAFYGQKPDTSVDGRVVTATATVSSAEIERFHSQFPGEANRAVDRTPTASFGFDYEETGDGVGTLEITHEGGDSIPRPKYIDDQVLHYAGTILQDKVMFGTDYPMIHPGEWLESLEESTDYSDDVYRKLLWENAEEFLDL